MPCAFEAQTVVKTFCLWRAIPRVGEWVRAKNLLWVGVFLTKQTQKKAKQHPTKIEPKQPKRHPGNYVKHYASEKSPSRSVLLRDVFANPTHSCPRSKSGSAGRWSCIISVIEQGWEVGSPTSMVDVAVICSPPIAPGMEIVFSPNFILRIIPRLVGSVGKVWKLGLVGVDLLDDGVRECWPGVSSFCLFLERIDSHCVCLEENQF